jgi:two-component system phosphate regulon response regulator OmpR
VTQAERPARVRLLIVDDDRELCAMLLEYLGPEGFLAETAATGQAGLERIARGGLDLVVLDVMLPELSGFEVLRRVRATSPIPVLMLTARGEEIDRVVGLEMGADDYLAKPFSPRELVARIRAILRRIATESPPGAPLLVFGPLSIDPRAHCARIEGQDLELTSSWCSPTRAPSGART